ncbi:hypothetical protein BST81_11525 [Leptolyngbya sp. 'hensonii']|nr:hypothetical protein BST81_11525 [Leptolyngbya sp. 'hensonii']
MAKTDRAKGSMVDLTARSDLDGILAEVAVQEAWGIGHHIAEALRDRGIGEEIGERIVFRRKTI